MLAIVSQASAFHVQDDSYMYARYAHNLVSGHGLAWDPGGEPTYGATALFFVPWVAAIGALFPGSPARIVVFASVAAMLLALVAIALLVRRLLPAATPGRALVIAVLAAVLATAHCGIAAHATNGMDTGLAMASLALLLLAWSRSVASGAPARGRSGVTLVLASFLAFGVRPDLGLYALGIPLALIVLAPRSDRPHLRNVALANGLAIAALLGWAWWYFGTPLTLSFYAKALHAGYGAPFVQKHAPVAAQQFALFTAFYAPLWIVALLDLPARWRARHASESALWLGVFAATLLHWLYYRFAVMQVVGSWQRFFYPTLPALVLLGVASGARLVERWNLLDVGAARKRVLVVSAFAACTLASAAALALPRSVTLKLLPSRLRPYRDEFESSVEMFREEHARGQLLNYDMGERFAKTKARSFWFALDRFSALPDDISIATSEVGLPAALNPGKRVFDLVGLNENGFALHGFDARRLCAELAPDVLYLPHPDYTTQIEMLMSEPGFQRDYELHPKAELGSFMDLALRRSSPRFEELRAIVASRLAEPPPPRVPPR
ncbi:MAG TPA: hypothetical protein VM509_00585 [Planctomycetota bacterium]|nr:hypothetical protein [Planctomycetota bacterium]